MKYSVTFYTTIDEYDWVCPQHFVAGSPQEAAVAERKYIFDECFGIDEKYEMFDRCYKYGEPDRVELLVAAEDGKSWLVTIESSPTTYDVRREKPIVWDHVVVSCEPADVRFRWYEYTKEDHEVDEDLCLSEQDLPYGAVHHVCSGDPCAKCTELDATIAARTQTTPPKP